MEISQLSEVLASSTGRLLRVSHCSPSPVRMWPRRRMKTCAPKGSEELRNTAAVDRWSGSTRTVKLGVRRPGVRVAPVLLGGDAVAVRASPD